MTPDLPIPEAAIEAAEQAMRGHDCHPVVNANTPHLARVALAAALPHLRSLQVETQVEYGRALGRKEAAEEIAQALDACVDDNPIEEGYVDDDCVLVRRAAYLDAAGIARDMLRQPQNATSEPRTDLPVGPSHPQDSKTWRERNLRNGLTYSVEISQGTPRANDDTHANCDRIARGIDNGDSA